MVTTALSLFLSGRRGWNQEENVYSINMAELDQLDEVLSWCMKYNMHMMLSITGLPGVAGQGREIEDVNRNGAAFTDPEMGQVVTDYWAMLSRRYAGIPSGALSFELLAEMIVPSDSREQSAQRYQALMVPIVRQMQADNPRRIVITYFNDGCEKLLEMGCCLSDHLHVQAVTREMWNDRGIPLRETPWPANYLPGALVSPENEALTLNAESAFSEGEFRMYVKFQDANIPTICVDGVPQQVTETRDEQDLVIWCVPIPEGAGQITVTSNGGFIHLWMVELTKGGEVFLQIASHWPECDLETELFPAIMIHDDGTVSYLNGEAVDREYHYQTRLEPMLSLAKRYKVAFIATEVGSDTTSLTPEEYLAYHEMWLSLYQEYGVGWMYNCDLNIFAPQRCMWLNGENNPIPFEHFSRWEDGPYWIHDDIMRLLKQYQ